MKAKFCCFGLLAASLLAGCLPSLNPVFLDENLVYDPHMLGAWTQSGSKARWEFSQRDKKSYHLLYTDQDGHQGRFIARLADLNGNRFLDLFPEQVETGAAAFYKFHLVPIHTIYWVPKSEPNLEFRAIDYKWLEGYLAEHPDEIPCSTFDGRRLITVPTKDVQAFVVKHVKQFTGAFGLERESPKVN